MVKIGFKYLCLEKIVSYHKKNNIVPQMINLKMGFEYNIYHQKYLNKFK